MPRASKSGPERERATASINALVPPTMRRDFEGWAAIRGLSLSAAVKSLISDALVRDARTPHNALYRSLPVNTYDDPGTAAEGVVCGCCGMRHGRALRPGEHCDWCVYAPGHPHHAGVPYRPLPDEPSTPAFEG